MSKEKEDTEYMYDNIAEYIEEYGVTKLMDIVDDVIKTKTHKDLSGMCHIKILYRRIIAEILNDLLALETSVRHDLDTLSYILFMRETKLIRQRLKECKKILRR